MKDYIEIMKEALSNLERGEYENPVVVNWKDKIRFDYGVNCC